ncbi:MAG: PEGA domain-containing protein, partial [Acidobacteriota bacterium]
MKRFPLLGAVAAALPLGAGTTASAQVMVGVPPYPYRYAVRADSSVRIEVTPREAEVYVDGYYAGIVDDFDGVFQRLRTEPGHHEVTLYLNGYRTVRQDVYLMPDKTFEIKLRMEPLAPGDTAGPRPTPQVNNQPGQGQGAPQGAPLPGRPGGRRGPRGGFPPGNMPPNMPPNQGPDGAPSAPSQAAT